MLSTQDLQSWVKQRQRYAEGSLDMAFKDNPLFKRGLSFAQKICYFNTAWSYFAPLWLIVFLLSPVIFFFTLHLPVKAYSIDFFKHFLPFQVMNTITLTLACWGISTKRADQYYLASFWFMLTSIFKVLLGKKVKFNVTPKNALRTTQVKYVLPHLIIVGLTLLGITYNIILISLGRHPSLSGFTANTFWCIFNISALGTMIRAAFWKPSTA